MARNWAITIGINGYRFLQPLNYAMPDADAVRQFFVDELGFYQVYHFTDNSSPIQQDRGPDLDSQPTSTTIGRFLRTRFEKPFLRDGDNLWFFFAGHGIRYKNRDYLMPLDGDRDDLERSAIPLQYVSERLRRSGADNVILLVDACRSYEGRRDGIGFGKEIQQGVVTLFSCSPEESSYEIQELRQGAFTHVLLDSLRLQGEGNCATVERLYHRLRRYVPQVTRQYKQARQTPYGMIEPPSKNHLILLPQQATLTDVVALKNDALTAELAHDSKMAKQFWIRVLMVSPGDSDAIAGIERLSKASVVPPLIQPNKSPSVRSSTGLRSPVPALSTSEQAASPTKKKSQELISNTNKTTSPYSLSGRISRRSLILIGSTIIPLLIGGIVVSQNMVNTVPQSIENKETSVSPPPSVNFETDRPPASTAPVYVEAEAEAEVWVSVFADDETLFEGTMQPGDTAVWEAQETISVYAGDAGAVNLSSNGGKFELMGDRGLPEEKTFSRNRERSTNGLGGSA